MKEDLNTESGANTLDNAATEIITEEEIVETENVDKISEIQQAIITLNDNADSISSKALENVKTSDLTEHQETLVAAVISIQEATGEQTEAEDGILSSFFNKLGSKVGFVKKVKKSVQEKFVENASLQENIDTIFDSLEGSIQATEQDIDILNELKESLSESVEQGNKLVDVITEMKETLGESDQEMSEKSKLDGLHRELKSINLVNNNTANQISAQIQTTSGLAAGLREVRPILKNLIKSQTLVALQNARLGQAKEVRDLVSGVVNDFVTKNNENTQATILDAIEYSGSTIISKDTVDTLGEQHTTFVKELKSVVSGLNTQKLEYNKSVDRVTKQLNEGVSKLPKLMAGETTETKRIKSSLNV